jgi:alkylation response protein AidB-like acyl-CoA dehydrogenase
VELVLLCEQWGQQLAPVPLAEAVVAARLLARLAPSSDAAAAALGAAIDGSQLVTIALNPAVAGVPQLVPAAAVADQVVALVDDTAVVVPTAEAEAVPNLGHTPLAWLDVAAAGGTVVAQGSHVAAAFAAARRDWQVVMAAALTGMAEATLTIGVEHARDRIAFGVPIGSFQAVAHPLVDVAMNVETSRRLTRKAAWWADTDPAAHRELVPMAYHFAEHTAVHATTVGVHTLGGVGFTVESDVQLYFRRAKGWSLVGGDPGLALDEAAAALFDEPSADAEVAA